MQAILLPIHPEFADSILAGEKQFEFRTKLCKRPCTKIVIYATAPISKIVGEVEVSGTVEAAPEILWEKTKHAAGISKEYFDRYFAGRETACAYCLARPMRYDRPFDLSALGIKAPPQSFIYL